MIVQAVLKTPEGNITICFYHNKLVSILRLYLTGKHIFTFTGK